MPSFSFITFFSLNKNVILFSRPKFTRNVFFKTFIEPRRESKAPFTAFTAVRGEAEFEQQILYGKLFLFGPADPVTFSADFVLGQSKKDFGNLIAMRLPSEVLLMLSVISPKHVGE